MVEFFFQMDDICVESLVDTGLPIFSSKHFNSTILTFVMSAHLYNSGVFLLAVNELFCG